MLNLLVLLPVALFALAAVGILILQQARPSIGYAWLIGALAGLVTVGAVIFLRWHLPLQVSIHWWNPFGGETMTPSFRLDESSWPYALALALLALAGMLTDAARLEREARPGRWAAGLAVTALGLIAVTAANPITLILAWTAVDLVELMMVITTDAGRRMSMQTITLFSVRVAGTLLVVLAILLARSRAIAFELSPIPPELAVIMLIAAGLRLGVLPLNIPYTREVYGWRGLGNIMRMLGPASSMVVLGRMPEGAVPAEWKGLFLFFSALAAVYGAAMWLASDSEMHGRPYWFTALAALGVASVVNGSPRASIAWGMVLLLSGSLLFYYSARRRQILFIPLLGILGIIGLPYTPAAAGWLGVVGVSSGSFTLLFLLAVLFLVWGYLRHLFVHPRDELYPMERWIQTVYPAGLLFLVAGQWLAALLGGRGSLTVGVWWASAIVAFLAALGVVLVVSFRGLWVESRADAAEQPAPGGAAAIPASAAVPAGMPIGSAVLVEGEPEIARISAAPNRRIVRTEEGVLAARRWTDMFARQVGGTLAAFFRLNWLYRFIAWIYHVVQAAIQLLTDIFEGDGGVLWSLVMLALLISLITTGGGR